MELQNLDSIIQQFKEGKIGIFPTDTAFGIGCRIDQEEGIQKIFKIRNRPENKPLLVLVDSIEMAEKYLLPISQEVRQKIIEKYWPGGVTIILRCKTEKVLPIVRSNGSTLAVRLPDHSDLLKVISGVGVPIVAPSANRAGEETPYHLSEVDQEIVSQVDFAMKGECTIKQSSTIIDCSATPWKIIRSGAVKINV